MEASQRCHQHHIPEYQGYKPETYLSNECGLCTDIEMDFV